MHEASLDGTAPHSAGLLLNRLRSHNTYNGLMHAGVRRSVVRAEFT